MSFGGTSRRTRRQRPTSPAIHGTSVSEPTSPAYFSPWHSSLTSEPVDPNPNPRLTQCRGKEAKNREELDRSTALQRKPSQRHTGGKSPRSMSRIPIPSRHHSPLDPPILDSARENAPTYVISESRKPSKMSSISGSSYRNSPSTGESTDTRKRQSKRDEVHTAAQRRRSFLASGARVHSIQR